MGRVIDKSKIKTVTIESLRSKFRYKNGHLFRTSNKHISKKRWGKPCGWISHDDQRSYLKIKIDGKSYPVHRIIWAIHYGHWPNIIDHINGVGTDNRIENLRDVDHNKNAQNKIMHRSGRPVGVYFDKRRSHWIAEAPEVFLKWKGKSHYIGSYKTMAEAGDAVKKYCSKPKMWRLKNV